MAENEKKATATATEKAQAIVQVQELTKTIEELKNNIDELKSNNQDLLKANSILSSKIITSEEKSSDSESKTDINEISRKDVDKKVADMLIAHTTGKREIERKLSLELEQIAKDVQSNKSMIIED